MARRAAPGRRRVILAVARDLFNRQGYSRTSMRQIAEQAGVAHGTIYLYFGTKLAVADALIDSYISDISVILEKSLSGSLGPEQIRTCVHKILLHASKNSDIVRLLDIRVHLGLENIRQPDADKKLQKMLSAVIAEGIKRGRFREYDTFAAAALVSGLVEWITRYSLMWLKCDTSLFEETAIQMLEHALIKS
ncbi:MAG: TetR/AcrR family transcriptional regulator [Dehalococcoidia bacterium]|nr:TetR/AcrR family transcriptional regulator [Dehalococcoidia bacterium]MDD5647730.1 TetR/AcrR family transcriptional regulator [Dehalococcoidia bacterium]